MEDAGPGTRRDGEAGRRRRQRKKALVCASLWTPSSSSSSRSKKDQAKPSNTSLAIDRLSRVCSRDRTVERGTGCREKDLPSYTRILDTKSEVKDELDDLLSELPVQFEDAVSSSQVNEENVSRSSFTFERGQQVDIGQDMMVLWTNVGLSKGLNTDPEIAVFLLQHYESTKNLMCHGNSCRVCQQPLTLVCSHCKQPVSTVASSRAVSFPSLLPQRAPAKERKRRREKSGNPERQVSKRECKTGSNVLRISLKDKSALAKGKTRKGRVKEKREVVADTLEVVKDDAHDSEDVLDDTADNEDVFNDDVIVNNDLPSCESEERLDDAPEGEEKGFSCKVCCHSYSRAGTLRAHMKKHAGDKPFKCSLCEAAFCLSGSLIVHSRTHSQDKRHCCEDCGRSFAISSALKQHRRQHTGERPFQCTLCPARYSRSDSLKVHMRSHSGDRPFICEVCGADFSRLYCLIAHKKKHSGERPFRCSECPATFTQSGKLTIHMRKHTGDRPFQCEQCGASFAQSDRLKTHLRTHSGEKPYRCGHCGKGFSHPHSLKVHARTHTGHRPYKCDVCSRTFADPSYFRRHKAKHSALSTKLGAINEVHFPADFPGSSSADVGFAPPASSVKGFVAGISTGVDISVPNSSAAFPAANCAITSVNQDCFLVTSTNFSIPSSSSALSSGFSNPGASSLGFCLPSPSSVGMVTDGRDAVGVTCDVGSADPFSFLAPSLHCAGGYPANG